MSNVVRLKPCTDVAGKLRDIASEIEAGEFGPPEEMHATLIIGANVWGLGTYDDGDAARNTVFDCNVAIAKLMKPVCDYQGE